jgi:PAS domain S-box-containing protein
MQGEVYKSILRSLTEAVCAVDSQRRIQCLNHQAELLTGMNAQDAIGMSLNELFSPDAGEVQATVDAVTISREAISTAKTNIVNCQGERIPVIVRAAPVLDEAHRIRGVVLTFRDNPTTDPSHRKVWQNHAQGHVVSGDKRIQRILHALPNVAKSDASVLITGPTGTGKELLARAIHVASHRNKRPFLALNCGALPDTLLESELFGYKKGAFTDATADKQGRFALAEGGTLLLDEIGDISPAMQVKLLRVLEERQYEPLGSTTSITTNVRIVATTNRDVHTMVASGVFRSDLYYRLNVIEFCLPPLAERTGDIPLLLEHFIKAFNAQTGRRVRGVSDTAMDCLLKYSYPGNVRELRNIVEHAYAICTGDELCADCLPSRVLNGSLPPAAGHTPMVTTPPFRRMPREKQRQLITQVLQTYCGHRGKAAEALQIDKSTLWRRMKSLGVEYV